MNNISNFINRNFSVFSLLSMLLIVYSVFKILTTDGFIFNNFNIHLVYYFVIGFALILLVFDFILKKIIENRVRLNVIQLIVSISFIIIIYFEYFKLKS